jgi:uncharacterized membrane protein YsdA (DUF1294 family)
MRGVAPGFISGRLRFENKLWFDPFLKMNLKHVDQWELAWIAFTSVWAFLLFGFDKWRAGHTRRRRVAESSLCLLSAIGGWPGALLGIVVFRHKSSKPSFLFKFFLALVVWAALVVGGWTFRR